MTCGLASIISTLTSSIYTCMCSCTGNVCVDTFHDNVNNLHYITCEKAKHVRTGVVHYLESFRVMMGAEVGTVIIVLHSKIPLYMNLGGSY